MGMSKCEICSEYEYLDEFSLGNKSWWVCRDCVKYGLIMLINKVKPKKELEE